LLNLCIRYSGHYKLLIQVYCAYAEALFSKTIHTPYGLSINEIEQIKTISSRYGISFGWKKCFELAISKVDGDRSSDKPNALKKINSLIDSYIVEPHGIRNKIAHGQWKKTLNRENTKLNNEITLKIQNLNIINLYRNKEAFESLQKILEDMIESPNKSYRKNYWVHITEFEEKQKEMSIWSIEKK